MDFAELFEAISTHYPSHKGVIMTIAEQLEEKGLEKGRAEGLLKAVLKSVKKRLQKPMHLSVA